MLAAIMAGGGEEGGGSDPSADALARSFALGDPGALAQVEGIASRVVRHRGFYIPVEDRQDIVQEVMAQVWSALAAPGAGVRRSFVGFVQAIACRRCVDWMRRHRATAEIDPAIPDAAGPPDQAYLMQERRALGLQVLGELREACRDLIRLVILEERSYREIALSQGRGEGALRTQMAECLKEARAIRARLLREPRPRASGGGRR
jgi:RNA polymerase sigma factor (sigma-70 family)